MNDKKNSKNRGIIIIVSGPSASGKGTVVSRALAKADDARLDVQLSVSMTTRGIGKGEVDGETYFYVSKEAFEKNIAENNLVEYNSYAGEYYGTPKDKLEDWLNSGSSVILEIALLPGTGIPPEKQGTRQRREDKIPPCKGQAGDSRGSLV